MKPKILGIGNRDRYAYIIFKKEQKLLQLFRKILLNLEETEDVVDAMVYQGGLCGVEELKEEGKKLKEVKINSLQDKKYNFSGDYFNIDIIYGNKKVFLIGYMNKGKREKMMKIARKECLF